MQQGLRAKKVTWIPKVILIIIVMFVVNCTDGPLRLVGGSTDREEGRVEVCVGGRWGTVQTNQSLEVAETVCRSQSQILSFYSTSSCYG